MLSVTEIMLLRFSKENKDHQYLNSINFNFNEHSERLPNTPAHPLHVSVCFEEMLFVFNEMQISGGVFCNLAEQFIQSTFQSKS